MRNIIKIFASNLAKPILCSEKLMLFLMLIAMGALAFPCRVSAVLGGDEASVQADQKHMRARLQIKPSQDYTVHEMTEQAGTIVKEYISPEGKVFAVVWHGPFIPDLRQLFGDYFEQYSQAIKARSINLPRIRGPLYIQEPGLVVQTGGHMRAYFGIAYIPELVPQGVSIKDLQ